MPLSGQGAAVTTAVLAVLTGITLSAILIAVSPRRRLLDRQSFVVGVSGLRNRGESRCYFNAVLQALAATPTFIAITTVLDNPNDGGCERNEGNEGKEDVPVVHSHDSSEPHSDRSDTPLANAMVALAISINQCDPVATASAIADRVLSEYCQQGGRFEYGEQDAHEFLVRLVEIVQTEQSAARLRRPALAAPWMIGPRGTASTSGLRPCVGGGRPGAGEGWRDPPTRGLLSSCVVCLSCSASTTEQIGEFSCVTCMLPIVGGVVSVAECLAEHFRPVLVSGYSCENCNTRGLPSSGSACKVTRAPRLPQVLVVHFSRVAAVGCVACTSSRCTNPRDCCSARMPACLPFVPSEVLTWTIRMHPPARLADIRTKRGYGLTPPSMLGRTQVRGGTPAQRSTPPHPSSTH